MENNHLLFLLLVFFFSYLIGATPFGYIIAKVVKGIDIREHGSKNIGATNVARVLGRKYFFIIFALDALKGIAPIFFISQLILTTQIVKTLVGTFAIFGHMFPIYLKFKGGKGVATGAGVIFALNWQVGIIVTAVWLVAFFASGYVSFASIITALALPIAYILLNETLEGFTLAIFFTLVAIIVIIKHSANIKRLVNGTESKVLWVKK